MKLIKRIKNKYPTASVLFYKSLVVFLGTAAFVVGLVIINMTAGINISSVFQFLQLDHITLFLAFTSGGVFVLSGLYMLASPTKKGISWAASRDYSPLLSGLAVVFSAIGSVVLLILAAARDKNDPRLQKDTTTQDGDWEYGHSASLGPVVMNFEGKMVTNANYMEENK